MSYVLLLSSLTVLVNVLVVELLLLLAHDAEDAGEQIPAARGASLLCRLLLGIVEVEFAKEACKTTARGLCKLGAFAC